MGKHAKKSSIPSSAPVPASRASGDNVIPLPVGQGTQASAPSSGGRSKKKSRKGKRERRIASGTVPRVEATATLAIPEADEPEADAEEERFFSDPPAAPATSTWSDFEGADADPEHRKQTQRGQIWTLAVLALGVLGIGGFLLTQKVLMPTPADLPATPVALPTPEMMQNLPEVRAEDLVPSSSGVRACGVFATSSTKSPSWSPNCISTR